MKVEAGAPEQSGAFFTSGLFVPIGFRSRFAESFKSKGFGYRQTQSAAPPARFGG
jgi:hypothetical protein